jgi:hypothetical protein
VVTCSARAGRWSSHRDTEHTENFEVFFGALRVSVLDSAAAELGDATTIRMGSRITMRAKFESESLR